MVSVRNKKNYPSIVIKYPLLSRALLKYFQRFGSAGIIILLIKAINISLEFFFFQTFAFGKFKENKTCKNDCQFAVVKRRSPVIKLSIF